MATAQSTTTPSCFNFLKEGLLLPSHNWRLFAAVFSVLVASTCLLLAVNHAAVQPPTDEIVLDIKALNSTDPSSPDFFHLLQKTQDDTRALLFTGTAYLLLAVIVVSAVRLVVVFAAVATYSGELHTFGSLLGKVRTQLKGPLLTLAFVYGLEIAYFALLAAMIALLILLAIKQYFVLFCVAWLLLLVPIIFLVYLSFVFSLSVVVAVAEPGRHGAGALGRAWRLVKGKRRRAVLFIAVTILLGAAFLPVQTTLAKTCAQTSKAAGLLLRFLYVILMSAVQLFHVCAMAAFYYECKGSTETEASVAEYLMVSAKEEFDA